MSQFGSGKSHVLADLVIRFMLLEQAGHRCKRCGRARATMAHELEPYSISEIESALLLCEACHRRGL